MTETNCFSEENHLHYSVHGTGKPVILIHGFAASNYDWVYLTPELINNGYQVIAPDLIGHGNSSKPSDPACYTFCALYDNFTEWINGFGMSKDLTMIGHSMGGLVALLFASDCPESVNQIVLIDPYFNRKQLNSILRMINNKPEWYQQVLKHTPKWLIHTAISLDVYGLIHYETQTRKQIAEDYKRASPEIAYIPGSIPNITEKIEQVQSPTLVIWGANDATLRPKSFPMLVDKLANGQGKSIQGAGHQPHLEKPDLFNPIVLNFLGANHE
jgi:pimeloyl-ACP methyl ester carboxylesterase